jgi:hypothetical protein
MGAGGKLRFKKLAHVVNLALDGVAGDGAFGPAFGYQCADCGAVQREAFVKNGAARRGGLGGLGGIKAAKVQHEMVATGLHRAGHRRLELGAGAQSLHGSDRRRGAYRLDSQAFTAFGATCVDHCAAATGFHADQEAMGAGAADFGGLVSAFHLDFLTDRIRHLRLFIKISE